MNRTSQVDKFNRRYGKNRMDEDAIAKSNIKKEQETSDYVEGTKELMEKGNIKEAAVVFSVEGMSVFAKLFGNSIERTITDVLTNRMDDIMKGVQNSVDSIIESKMLQMLDGMTEGMKKFLDQSMENNMPKLDVQFSPPEVEEPNTEEPMISPIKFKVKPNTVTLDDGVRLEPVKAKNPEPPDNPYAVEVVKVDISDLGLEPSTRDGRLGINSLDLDFAESYLMPIFKKYIGKDIKSGDLFGTLKNELNVVFTNPTASLRKVMGRHPGLENTGYGLYRYTEKNFKPTI